MSKLIHTSKVRIHQDKRPIRRAYIEDFKDPRHFWDARRYQGFLRG